MFQNESKLWNWLVVSSEDPTKVAATVKGITGAFVIFLAYFIHAPNMNDLPDTVYSVVTTTFGIFSGALVLVGLVRKIYHSFTDATPSA